MFRKCLRHNILKYGVTSSSLSPKLQGVRTQNLIHTESTTYKSDPGPVRFFLAIYIEETRVLKLYTEFKVISRCAMIIYIQKF